MLEALTAFVAELRRAGLPVSPDEVLDATRAVLAIGLSSRRELRAALRACVVKDAAHVPAFDTLFELYFPASPGSLAAAAGGEDTGDGGSREGEGESERLGVPGRAGSELPEPLPGREELRALLLAALADGDPSALERAARLAVALLAGIEAGRPVGPSYYIQRTLRGIDTDALLEQLLAAAARPVGPDAAPGPGGAPARRSALGLSAELGSLRARLQAEEYRERIAELRRAVEAEVQRRLALERGVAEVSASIRRPLAEDVEFMHASLDELAAMRRALAPLTRILAARLARRRRHRRRGPLDFRATIRRSLSTGGVPLELRFKSPHPSRPELFVLADVSGSVASFARFTLLLLAAMGGQFSTIRSFLFIDGVDEVTAAMRRAGPDRAMLDEALRDADVVASDGHSDYGRAMSSFAARYGADIGPRTTLIVLGDARSNYHPPGAEVLALLARRARHLYWLNPEPRAYWNSGDSAMSLLAPYCDAVVECRNLRQLEAFVTELV